MPNLTTREINAITDSESLLRFLHDKLDSPVGDKDKWRIAEIRTGDLRWEDVDMLLRALNAEKTQRARAELETTEGAHLSSTSTLPKVKMRSSSAGWRFPEAKARICVRWRLWISKK